MSDFMSVQPVAGMGNAVRPAPPEPQPAIKAASKSDDASASKDYANDRGASAQAAKAREFAKAKALGDKILTGPPPSFEASLLEVEGQLDNIIKRMEAARERSRTEEAVAATPRTQPDASVPANQTTAADDTKSAAQAPEDEAASTARVDDHAPTAGETEVLERPRDTDT